MIRYLFLCASVSVATVGDASLLSQHQRLAGFDDSMLPAAYEEVAEVQPEVIEPPTATSNTATVLAIVNKSVPEARPTLKEPIPEPEPEKFQLTELEQVNTQAEMKAEKTQLAKLKMLDAQVKAELAALPVVELSQAVKSKSEPKVEQELDPELSLASLAVITEEQSTEVIEAVEPIVAAPRTFFITGKVVEKPTPITEVAELESEPTSESITAAVTAEVAVESKVELLTEPATAMVLESNSEPLALERATGSAKKDEFAQNPLAVAPLEIDINQLRKGAFSSMVSFDRGPDQQRTNSDLVTMVHKALQWHPSVRQARSQILASQEQIEAAKSGYYPQVSTGLNTGYRDSNRSGNESLNVSAKQMVYDFGKVSSTVKAAEHGLSQEQARLLLSVDQLIEKTAFASLELMRSQEKQTIAQEQMQALEEIWRLTKERSELGASAQSDMIQALSRKEAATALIWELKTLADVWLKELQSLTGERDTIYLSTDLPEHFALQCQNHTLQLDIVPMVRVLEEQRGTALAHLDLSTAEMYPTLSVDAGYDQYLRSRENFVNGRLENRSSDFSVMVNMSMSLFEGGGKVARKNAAQHMLQAVQAEKDNVVLDVTRGFEESQNKQYLLAQRLRVLAERISSIERTQELYKDQYISLGTRSLLDLLNTEQEIYQAKSDYIDNKYEMYKSLMACLYYGAQLRNAFEVNTIHMGG